MWAGQGACKTSAQKQNTHAHAHNSLLPFGSRQNKQALTRTMALCVNPEKFEGTAPNPSRETLFAFNQPCFCFSQPQHACRRVPTADCRLQTIGLTAHPTLSHTTRILLQISTGIKDNLPRVARGVLVDREVADVHKLVSKARFQRLFKLGRRVNPAVGVLSQRVGPAGRQDVGCPVQPRGHVGAKEGVHPKMELPPVPKQRSCYVALTRWGNG